MSVEQWREIQGFPLYEVSDHGRVRSWNNNRWGRASEPRIRKAVPSYGYPTVMLKRDGRRRAVRVHVLVMEAFVGPRPEGMEIRHLDGDKTNARLDNLAYGTRAENARDTVAHGQHFWAKRTACKNGHAYTSENTATPPGRGRVCLTCARERARQQRHRARRELQGGAA